MDKETFIVLLREELDSSVRQMKVAYDRGLTKSFIYVVMQRKAIVEMIDYLERNDEYFWEID